MKKGVQIALAMLFAALAAVGGAGAYYMHTLQKSQVYLAGTTINGEDVSGQTAEAVAGRLADAFDGGEVVVSEEGGEALRAGLPALGYTADRPALLASLEACMEAEKTDLPVVLRGLVRGNAFEVDIPYKEDKKIFDGAVSVEALAAPRRDNHNAKILYYEEEKTCKIKPEVQGTELEDGDLRDWLRGEIEAALAGGDGTETEMEMEMETGAETGASAGAETGLETGAAGRGTAGSGAGEKPLFAKGVEEGTGRQAGYGIACEIPASLYIPPARRADDEELRDKCEVLNKYAGESVTYVFGSQTQTLDFKTIMNWLKIQDGKATVREDKVRDYVAGLVEKYETRYHERAFTTSWGNVVTFPAGLCDYGYTILEEAEVARLTQDILSGESVEREPVYMTYNDWGCPVYLHRDGTDDLCGTYVEVSLSAQHMWYYVDGALLVESDVVTGDVTKDQGSAAGVFPLAFKESPSVLRGGKGKEKYETEVRYWMPYYEGQGLHDAWWKTVFGGTEYIGNGSHGCVNLPPWVAEVVYQNIVPGTAIILYW